MKIEIQDANASSEKKGENSQAERQENKNWLEWSVFGLGVLLTLSVLGYLIYESVVYNPSPPDLKVEYQIMPAQNGSNRIKLTVKNNGGGTAETVIVSASLERDGKEFESGDVQFEYVPKYSERVGWVVFENQIKETDKIRTNIESYLEP